MWRSHYHVKASRKSHGRSFLRYVAIPWRVRHLRGAYCIYVALMVSTWRLRQGRVYILKCSKFCHVKSARGTYVVHTWLYEAVRGDTWRYVAVRGGTWRYEAIRGTTW